MAFTNYLITNRHLADLNPLVLGEETCRPGHSFGPAVRDYTLIHYIRSGRGALRDQTGTHPVEAGQAFLIRPGEVTVYTADREQPWHYCWIGFDGGLSERFAQLPPVFELPGWVMEDMVRAGQRGTGAEYELAALLFRLYALLFAPAKIGPVGRVEDYIHSGYMTPIRVEALARQLNLDRRYLSRIFKEETGLSIKEYLTAYRLERARELLRAGCGVKEAALLCGWEDPSNFSRRFKQQFGRSPSEIEDKR